MYTLFPIQRSCFLARQPAGVLLSAVVGILNTMKVSEGESNTEKVDKMLLKMSPLIVVLLNSS